jgi:hypothetical protein
MDFGMIVVSSRWRKQLGGTVETVKGGKMRTSRVAPAARVALVVTQPWAGKLEPITKLRSERRQRPPSL